MGVRTPSYQAGFYAPERGGLAAYPQLWRGCVGAWNPGLGPSGLVLREWSGRKNHGTLTNMDADTGFGVSGGQMALRFDGTNKHVDVGSSNAVNSIVGSLTATAWFRFTAIDGQRWAIANVDSSFSVDHGFQLGTNAGKFAMYVFNGVFPGVESTTDIVANRLYHVAGTASASGMALYVDGNLVASNSNAAASVASPRKLIFGARERGGLSAASANGIIAEVRVYNRVLSAGEIRLLARRPGIAYELAPRKVYSLASPSSARLRRILTGAT